LLSDGIPWLPTDVLRTVLPRILPELDELDQGKGDGGRYEEERAMTKRMGG